MNIDNALGISPFQYGTNQTNNQNAATQTEEQMQTQSSQTTQEQPQQIPSEEAQKSAAQTLGVGSVLNFTA